MGDERARQLAALVAVEDAYDDAPVGYCAMRADGVIFKVNHAFLEWSGYSADEVVGRRRFEDFLTVGGKIFLATHFTPSLQMQGHVYEVAFEVKRKDGTVFPALVNAVERRDGAAEPLFIRITVFKTTQRHHYEQELLLARAEAERAANDLARTVAELSSTNHALELANQELSLFSHAASHDLQAPLRAVTSYIELLGLRCADRLDEQGRRYLQRVAEGAARMRQLIHDLLDLSQAGAATMVREDTRLDRLLDEVLLRIEADMHSTGAVVRREPLPCLTVDPRQVAQLFQNLLGNALKYRHPERAPEIQVSARREDAGWSLAVRDNGRGFAMAQAERIFAPFGRLHGSDIPGTGLGLALCRKVVDAHGGRIRAEAGEGQGATFHVWLPDPAAAPA